MFLKKFIENVSPRKNIKNYSVNAYKDHPQNLNEVHPLFFNIGRIDNNYFLVQGLFTHNPPNNTITEVISLDKYGRKMYVPLDKVEYNIIRDKEHAELLANQLSIEVFDKEELSANDELLAKDLVDVITVYLRENKKLEIQGLNNRVETIQELVFRLKNLDFENKNNNNILDD
jgi:hypothetical protein